MIIFGPIYIYFSNCAKRNYISILVHASDHIEAEKRIREIVDVLIFFKVDIRYIFSDSQNYHYLVSILNSGKNVHLRGDLGMMEIVRNDSKMIDKAIWNALAGLPLNTKDLLMNRTIVTAIITFVLTMMLNYII